MMRSEQEIDQKIKELLSYNSKNPITLGAVMALKWARGDDILAEFEEGFEKMCQAARDLLRKK